MNNSRKRHIAKAITWRIVGTIDTIVLSWLITGSGLTGFKIGLFELVTKTILYYLHERAWFKIRFKQTHKRHLFKTVTWRIVGSMDTFVLGWVVTGNPFSGFKISMAEVITKMVLYYFHEEVWYKVKFGLEKFKTEDKEDEQHPRIGQTKNENINE